MSNPASTPKTISSEVVPSRPAPLAVASEIFTGFALPSAVLHSIPPPAEFSQFVNSAAEENRAKPRLLRFLKPLFGRQGAVNKYTILALQSVGQSLTHLAREIEGRDRVLEQLATHINAYSEH